MKNRGIMQNLNRTSIGKRAVVSVLRALPPHVSHVSRGKVSSVCVAVGKHQVIVLLAALRPVVVSALDKKLGAASKPPLQ